MRERDRSGAGRASPVRVSLTRRRLLSWAVVPAAAAFAPAAYVKAAGIASARLWPAQEYTRLIIESPAPIAWQVATLSNKAAIVATDLQIVDAFF